MATKPADKPTDNPTGLTFGTAEVTKDDTRRGGRGAPLGPNPFTEAVKGLTPGSGKALTFEFEDATVKANMTFAQVRKCKEVQRYAEQLDRAGEANDPRVTVRKKFYVTADGKVSGKFWVEEYKPKPREAKPTAA